MPVLLRAVASALRRPRSWSFHTSTLLLTTTGSSAVATSVAPVPADHCQSLTLLEHSITQRLPTQALRHLAQLQSPPQPQLLQKLAVLLARQKKSRNHAVRAFEILRSVYRVPGLKPDDFTKLASIYVMDACLRFRMLDSAMELYDEAVNQAVVLDLPAYAGLLTALVEAKRMDEATDVLRELVNEQDVCPDEQIFLPVLLELIQSKEYENATDILKRGQKRGVEFTGKTFHPLLMMAEDDTAVTDSLVNFLSFVEESWEEYKATEEFEPEEDDMDESDTSFDL